MKQAIFTPSNELIQDSNLYHFMIWLNKNHGLHFEDYDALWQWSIGNIEEFWTTMFEYFEIDYQGTYSNIKSQSHMPGILWFEGMTLNYARHMTRSITKNQSALIACNEQGEQKELNWGNLLNQAAQLQALFHAYDMKLGDRIVAYLPNIPEASIGLLAALASGLVWSSCSPDFGSASVIDRFKQIEPRLLIAVDQYQYGGKKFDRGEAIAEIIKAIPSLEVVIMVNSTSSYTYKDGTINILDWNTIITQSQDMELEYVNVPFNHPMWVVYSSGTTGLPKAITHSQGGLLLEHLKYIHFHNNVKPGERFFWFTTTGWMMWNYLHASWLGGATLILYDGHPGYPDNQHLWQLAQELSIDHFGISAPFLHSCIKEGIELPPLLHIRSISSTGSPLNDEVYLWLYSQIKHDFYLWSMSGGTDIATAFVGGCPIKPIYVGEIQCRALGCDLKVWDEKGEELINTVGELVITQPMPCMPIYFWNDPHMKKYGDSYFTEYSGYWRHGDWIKLTSQGGLIISGRSDTTLKRFGVRIGTAEIYAALLNISSLDDALIIHYDDKEGNAYMPLFVKLKVGLSLDESLRTEIKHVIKTKCSPRHLPDSIVQVKDIPYTLSGKKMEAPIKKIFLGKTIEEVITPGSMRNPDCLKEFENIYKKCSE